jgi:hypothetical protein
MLHLDVSALHLLPTQVIPHVCVLVASGRHAILAKCDTTLIVLVNCDGRPEVLVKLMEQLLKNISPHEWPQSAPYSHVDLTFHHHPRMDAEKVRRDPRFQMRVKRRKLTTNNLKSTDCAITEIVCFASFPSKRSQTNSGNVFTPIKTS